MCRSPSQCCAPRNVRVDVKTYPKLKRWWLSGDGCSHSSSGTPSQAFTSPQIKSSSCVPATARPLGSTPFGAGEGLRLGSRSPLNPWDQPSTRHRAGAKPAWWIRRKVYIKGQFKGPVPLQRKRIDKNINHVFLLIRPFTQKCSFENL